MGRPIFFFFFLQNKILTSAKNQNEHITGTTERSKMYDSSMKPSFSQELVEILFNFMGKFKEVFFYKKLFLIS